MSVGHKSSNTQIFRLILYRRGLHPELFNLEGRRLHRQPEYDAECWVMAAGHVVRFQVGSHAMTETVLERGDHLPETGLIHALPCLGEKDYDFKPAPEDKLGYTTTVQTETLTENLYLATYRELHDFARENDALRFEYDDAEGNPCLSLLDVQKFKREFHVQSYHLVASTGLVLRTQTIFERL